MWPWVDDLLRNIAREAVREFDAEQRLRAVGLWPAAAAWLARRLPRWAVERIIGGK